MLFDMLTVVFVKFKRKSIQKLNYFSFNSFLVFRIFSQFKYGHLNLLLLFSFGLSFIPNEIK